MKPTCLFIGRFQPFHNGHLMVIKGMTKVCGKILIGIGSSEKSGSEENPFTASDRKEMIQRALQAEDIIPMFDVEFVELPDHEDDAKWTEHVLERVGRVDKIWTGNEWTKKCFEGKVEVQWIKEVPGFSSTDIRALIKKDGDWEEKVPEEVYRYILAMRT
ncbi:adenylyltransferase/cytidyltransferase family protein [Candidatus Uhrbacteria bacterium]|nr:adenylyltransferase/cytidyltransferase family protein [Candidatus Uhrbacteria bacterium]